MECSVSPLKIVVFIIWSVGFVLGGLIVLSIFTMGDCLEGPKHAACVIGTKRTFWVIATIELVVYFRLTWSLFLPSGRKR
jgi:hypothetical protein